MQLVLSLDLGESGRWHSCWRGSWGWWGVVLSMAAEADNSFLNLSEKEAGLSPSKGAESSQNPAGGAMRVPLFTDRETGFGVQVQARE